MKAGERRGAKMANIWRWLSKQKDPQETSFDTYVHSQGEVCSRETFSKSRLRYLVYIGALKPSKVGKAVMKMHIPDGFPEVHEPKVAQKAKKAANGETKMATLREENDYLRWLLHGERRGYVHRLLQEESEGE
jgi:hypothetical protein